MTSWTSAGSSGGTCRFPISLSLSTVSPRYLRGFERAFPDWLRNANRPTHHPRISPVIAKKTALRWLDGPLPAPKAWRCASQHRLALRGPFVDYIIIAGCVTGAVAAANHPTYLVGSIQEADNKVSPTGGCGEATQAHD